MIDRREKGREQGDTKRKIRRKAITCSVSFETELTGFRSCLEPFLFPRFPSALTNEYDIVVISVNSCSVF